MPTCKAFCVERKGLPPKTTQFNNSIARMAMHSERNASIAKKIFLTRMKEQRRPPSPLAAKEGTGANGDDSESDQPSDRGTGFVGRMCNAAPLPIWQRTAEAVVSTGSELDPGARPEEHDGPARHPGLAARSKRQRGRPESLQLRRIDRCLGRRTLRPSSPARRCAGHVYPPHHSGAFVVHLSLGDQRRRTLKHPAIPNPQCTLRKSHEKRKFGLHLYWKG
jgi:hypothetical protein